MSNVVKIAKGLRKQLGYNVTREALLQNCHERGYDVIYYDPKEGHSIISHLGIGEFAEQAKAFVVPSAKIIFVRKGYDGKTEAYLLAHELGHIILKHNVQPGEDNTIQEREANQFAEILLKPNRFLMLAHKYNRIAILLLLAIAVSMVVGVYIGGLRSTDTQTPPVTMPSSTETEINSNADDTDVEMVCVTTSGDKYHLPDCQYVRDKTNITTLTLDEAINMGYEPCKVCIGD